MASCWVEVKATGFLWVLRHVFPLIQKASSPPLIGHLRSLVKSHMMAGRVNNSHNPAQGYIPGPHDISPRKFSCLRLERSRVKVSCFHRNASITSNINHYFSPPSSSHSMREMNTHQWDKNDLKWKLSFGRIYFNLASSHLLTWRGRGLCQDMGHVGNLMQQKVNSVHRDMLTLAEAASPLCPKK